MSKIKIKNLVFSYNDSKVFNDLNFTLKKDKSLSIIGGSGIGKTTLLKLLNGEFKYDGEIYINGVLVDTDRDIFKEINVIYRDFSFECLTVKEELVSLCKRYNVDYFKFIEELNDFFGINKILRFKFSELSFKDQILIKIICATISNPSYVAIDDLLCYLDFRTKVLIFNYLLEKSIVIINVTSVMEDVLFTDYVLCLYDGISAIDGKTLDVLKNEQLLRRLGFNLPFIADLSSQLKSYGMVDKIYINDELLVNKLWK